MLLVVQPHFDGKRVLLLNQIVPYRAVNRSPADPTDMSPIQFPGFVVTRFHITPSPSQKASVAQPVFRFDLHH